MTIITKCDGCQQILKKEEVKQAQIWNSTVGSTIDTAWIQGPIIDLCGNCFATLTIKGKK